MKTKSPRAIRLSVTPEVDKALELAKKRYPTLTDPEILKLGLSNMISDGNAQDYRKERKEIQKTAAYSMGYDYLNDPEEDIYTENTGKKVDFS